MTDRMAERVSILQWLEAQRIRCDGEHLRRRNPFSYKWFWCAIAYSCAIRGIEAGEHEQP